MYYLRRKLFSQNFLHNRMLVSKLVCSSSIGNNDLVLEIGPGKGIITEVLINQARHVLAVEIDNYWYNDLQKRFYQKSNLTLYRSDILGFSLPSLPYKVFANIPFSIEGKIIRLLIDAKNPPHDAYLVVRKELAYRLAAPYRENRFSLAHKPWFELSICYHFRRSDFRPSPKVDAVLLRIRKKKNTLLTWNEKDSYQNFIKIGFGQGLPLWRNLSHSYGKTAAIRMLTPLGIAKKTIPSQINLRQWLVLYKNYTVQLKQE